ncbi:molybdenum cofactor guanylyltransferase [Ferruginibacter sp.]
MTGIILCGGQSSRMGTDKGLLHYEAKTWAQTALEKMNVLNIPVKISVNLQQQPEYEKVFAPQMLIADDASLDLKGPLLGVLSAHLQNSAEDLFILACDMPLMEPGLLKELFALYQQSKKYEVFIYTNNKEPEPLCGIYTSQALKKIVTMLRQDKLVRHSMKFVLSQLVVCEIALQENQKTAFRNFNAHAELNGL